MKQLSPEGATVLLTQGTSHRVLNSKRKRGLLGDAPTGYTQHTMAPHDNSWTRGRALHSNDIFIEGPRPQKRFLLTPAQTSEYRTLTPPLSAPSTLGSENLTDRNNILEFLNTTRDTQLALVCSLLKNNLMEQQTAIAINAETAQTKQHQYQVQTQPLSYTTSFTPEAVHTNQVHTAQHVLNSSSVQSSELDAHSHGVSAVFNTNVNVQTKAINEHVLLPKHGMSTQVTSPHIPIPHTMPPHLPSPHRAESGTLPHMPQGCTMRMTGEYQASGQFHKKEQMQNVLVYYSIFLTW